MTLIDNYPADAATCALEPDVTDLRIDGGDCGVLTGEDLAVLGTAAMFHGVGRAQLAGLLPAFTVRRVGAGDRLFSTGDQDCGVYVVLAGRFTLTRCGPDGGAVSVVLGPGDVSGDVEAFDPGPRSDTLTAVVDGRVGVVSAADLLAWATSSPQLTVAVLQVLAVRVRRAQDAADARSARDVGARLACTLLDLQARFGAPAGGRVGVRHGLTQLELARLVGTSRETLNKTLHGFAARGWLDLQTRTVVVLDRPELARRAGRVF